MAEKKVITIPDFDFSGFYYPDILRSLLQYNRANVPEITDESDEEPFQQLLRSYALVGHLNNVLLDITANEGLLTTARLLESVRGHLALIDVKLKQNTPATTDVVLELSKVFTAPTELVPEDSQFSTLETEASPQIIYETDASFTIEPTNVPTAIYVFEAGLLQVINNSFDGGDYFTLAGVQFRPGIEFAVGGSILATINNIVTAINNSSNDNILGRLYAISNGVDQISVIPLIEGITSIPFTLNDGATTNFVKRDGGFGSNKSGVASTPGVFWDLFPVTPKLGDIVYIGHTNVMWDTLNFTLNTPASGIEFVTEFYDATEEDGNPDVVTNLGSNLKFDLTTLLGTSDRKGTVLRVVLSSSGAFEKIVSVFEAGVNVAYTTGLLGQSSVSVDIQDYIIGSFWNELSDVTDDSLELTQDGELSYSLPQNQSQNWQKQTVNAVLGFWIRLRITKVTAPVNPSMDLIEIDTGKQFIVVPVVQGQTVVEAPLSSSNGVPNQVLTLTFKPIIQNTLLLEVDEGAGFQPWNQKDNFLSSNSASKDFTLEIFANDDADIQFGDGKQGKIPTPGVDNIRALYRIGADVNGNVGARTILVNKSGISFVTRIFNPRQATGWAAKEGSTEEDLARLKIDGPATLRTRNKAITTDDMEFLATQYISIAGSKFVARALAIEETFGVKTVELVVVGFGGTILTEAQREELADYFNGNKELGIKPVMLANHELTPVNYDKKEIDVTAVVVGGVQAEITNAIVAILNPEATFSDGVTKRWEFGQEIPISVIIAEIFEVDPVNIKKVTLTIPQAVGDAVPMTTRQLPFARNVSVTVV